MKISESLSSQGILRSRSALPAGVISRRELLLLAVSAVMLAGCAGSGDKRAPSSVGGATITPVVIGDSLEGTDVDPRSFAGRAPAERTIYFDYDAVSVRPEYLDLITQHGRYLARNGGGTVRLEGHTDERGSREYNIALGESRAKAIAEILHLRGADDSQTRSVSYGEEIPVDSRSTPDAWERNRRVDIVYVNPPN